MSVFNPTSDVQSGTILNVAGLLSVVKDKLPVKHTLSNGAGAGSMSSNTAATLQSVSVGVEADELVIFVTTAAISANNATGQLHHKVISSFQGYNYYVPIFNDTSGTAEDKTLVSVWQDLSGTISFELQWQRLTGAGTLYTASQRLHVLQFKRR